MTKMLRKNAHHRHHHDHHHRQHRKGEDFDGPDMHYGEDDGDDGDVDYDVLRLESKQPERGQTPVGNVPRERKRKPRDRFRAKCEQREAVFNCRV